MANDGKRKHAFYKFTYQFYGVLGMLFVLGGVLFWKKALLESLISILIGFVIYFLAVIADRLEQQNDILLSDRFVPLSRKQP